MTLKPGDALVIGGGILLAGLAMWGASKVAALVGGMISKPAPVSK